jgi:hypothetical protein
MRWYRRWFFLLGALLLGAAGYRAAAAKKLLYE